VRLDEIAMQVAWWLLGGRGSAFYSSSIDATAAASYGLPVSRSNSGSLAANVLTN
jgi:hypothetical protein